MNFDFELTPEEVDEFFTEVGERRSPSLSPHAFRCNTSLLFVRARVCQTLCDGC